MIKFYNNDSLIYYINDTSIMGYQQELMNKGYVIFLNDMIPFIVYKELINTPNLYVSIKYDDIDDFYKISEMRMAKLVRMPYGKVFSLKIFHSF